MDFFQDILTSGCALLLSVLITVTLGVVSGELAHHNRTHYLILENLAWCEMLVISYIIAYYFDLRDLQFGNIIYEILQCLFKDYYVAYTYYLIYIALFATTLALLKVKAIRFHSLYFILFPMIMVLLYFHSIQAGIHFSINCISWVLPFLYIVAVHSYFKDYVQSYFNREMRLDIINLILIYVDAGIIYYAYPYLDLKRICILVGELSLFLILIPYYHITSTLLQFYRRYISSKKNGKIFKKNDPGLHLRAILCFIGYFLVLYSIESAIFPRYARESLLYFLFFTHGYSIVMLIGYAVYQGEQILSEKYIRL